MLLPHHLDLQQQHTDLQAQLRRHRNDDSQPDREMDPGAKHDRYLGECGAEAHPMEHLVNLRRAARSNQQAAAAQTQCIQPPTMSDHSGAFRVLSLLSIFAGVGVPAPHPQAPTGAVDAQTQQMDSIEPVGHGKWPALRISTASGWRPIACSTNSRKTSPGCTISVAPPAHEPARPSTLPPQVLAACEARGAGSLLRSWNNASLGRSALGEQALTKPLYMFWTSR